MIIWHEQSSYPATSRAKDYTLAYREYLIFLVLLLIGFFAAQTVRATREELASNGFSSGPMASRVAQTGGVQ